MNDTSVTTPSWQDFLTSQGAHFDEANRAVFPGDATHASSETTLIPLSNQGMLAFEGEDASTFLHSQVTNDVEHLQQETARLAGYCSPKGRLLATFLLSKSANTLFMALAGDIIQPIHKRLQMFVLRAKVKISNVSEQYVQLGLTGDSADAVLQQWFTTLPTETYAQTVSPTGTLIRMPSVSPQKRYLLVTPTETAMAIWPQLTGSLRVAGTSLWEHDNILAGLPQITKVTQEQFVPQMINLELIGGINFRKGCYPGQEIVARSQYLGKIKRRMMLATINATAQAGQEIYSSDDPAQPCGMIVNAAPHGNGSSVLLTEIKLAALDATVHLGSASGPLLSFGTLPYSLEEKQ